MLFKHLKYAYFCWHISIRHIPGIIRSIRFFELLVSSPLTFPSIFEKDENMFTKQPEQNCSLSQKSRSGLLGSDSCFLILVTLLIQFTDNRVSYILLAKITG